AAVWTGNLMIVWGGWDSGGTSLASGGRYDPATDTWAPTTLAGAPQGRLLPSTIWTGDRMIIWGGVLYQCCPISNFTPLNSGGRYDPIADSWTATTLSGAPTPRYLQTTVWTGSRMVVWGGYDQSAALASGGRYDPATNTWDAMSASGAPAARYNHGAVMAAGSMVLWGGENGTTQFGDGGRYDPAGDTWLPLSVSGAPAARSSHSAISTDSSMVVWGGWDRTTRMNTGGRYDPVTDQWSGMSNAGAPSGRTSHSTVWTGAEMIVWGGSSGSSGLDSGGRYDPVSDSWSPMASIDSPRRRAAATGVWTGESMLIWGGYDTVNIFGGGSFDEELATGGQYCLCPMSAVYRDADADGLGDSGQTIQACAPPPGYVVAGGDCNDADGANWATPGEARNLQFTNATSLSWSPPSAPGSSAPHYDVIRSGSAADFVSAALCTATDTPLLSLGDSGIPAVSARFHYLIRARNGCPANAFGPLGNASNGTPRTALTCP
ncbi:MAG TPA: hypothetical protein VFW45_16000, partial [Candidatus Polarisedimenticolia bacterium]|nr:hypothetical protein [Candidatus Polarisedimenticolia bacterium]